MALIFTALKRLLPKGRAWNLKNQALEVVDGLATYLERPKEFLRAVQDEATPTTANLTIDQWIEMLGISVESDATLGEKRKIVTDLINSIGGQSLDYINGRIQSIFPNVYIDEDEAGLGVGPFTFYYYVRGFYPLAGDFVRLQSILDRVAPAHLIPVHGARSVYDGDVAKCFIATTGRAITGRTETAWTPTEGEVALSGVGVVGLALTGKTSV